MRGMIQQVCLLGALAGALWEFITLFAGLTKAACAKINNRNS